MAIETNLAGRVKHTNLAKNNGLMPLFETVVNSIHAIEDRGIPMGSGLITVEIIRSAQGKLEFEDEASKKGPDPEIPIVEFKVHDNGIGFTDSNLNAFKVLDTDHKASRGCLGVGRLLLLKAFKRVQIRSIFELDNGGYASRSFDFTIKNGVSEPVEKAQKNVTEPNTCVHLIGFQKSYQQGSAKTLTTIAESLFKHCLWYFARKEGAPEIIIRDTVNNEERKISEIMREQLLGPPELEDIEIKGIQFTLKHIKVRTNATQSHSMALCASNRMVDEEVITGKVAGLYGKLNDGNRQFTYICYISSPFLDERVTLERTGFNLLEASLDEGIFSDTEITRNEIRDAALSAIATHLSVYLQEHIKTGKAKLDEFISTKAPRYRPIINQIPLEKLPINPNASDREIELELHKHLSQFERDIMSQGHEVFTVKDNESLEDYQIRLREYISKVEDIKKSDLINYVFHRKIILELLEHHIKQQNNGKYARENIIHELIMPMGVGSEEIDANAKNCNLWIIDERLAFHNYLASDKPLTSIPITDSDSGKEPDICALNYYDSPKLVSSDFPLASITVVEFKRPMRNDASQGEEKCPIEQALGYLRRIREGGVKTIHGRPIPRSNDIPGYCYIICDITSTVQERCRLFDLTETYDHMGYFGFNKTYGAYIEVTSYDRLVKVARERNYAFFEKLGLPSS